jgi:hypothetical protein
MSKKRQAGGSAASPPTQQLNASPITALYKSAIRELDEINEAQAPGDDQLQACLDSLLIVKRLIRADPSAARATRSLDVLAMALDDIRKGAKPDMIFKRPKADGRPSNLSTDAIKGVAVACLKLLVEAKVEGASKKVADGLRKRGIKLPEGVKGPEESGAQRIDNWRKNIGGYRSAKAKNICDTIVKGLQANPAGRQATAELDVAQILDALKNKGF